MIDGLVQQADVTAVTGVTLASIFHVGVEVAA
jgi:hypothetical protein